MCCGGIVDIYTDGACSGNPGPGGYAVVAVFGDRRRELSGGFRLTTNNRMELFACIIGLERLKPGARVRVHTDSRYVADPFQKGWVATWRARGWRRGKDEPVRNVDLWKRLFQLVEERDVQFVWVRGHAGHPENEACDRLAVAWSRARSLPADEGYEAGQGQSLPLDPLQGAA